MAFPGVFSDESKVVNGKFFDRYGKYTANFKLSINDLFKGYDPERRFSVYALGGAGFSSNFRIKDFGYWSVMWQGGLGASYDFGKHGSVYAEYLVDNIANIPKFGHLHDLHGLLSVGLMYRFGLTDDDKSKMARNGQTSQKDYEVLSKRIIELENQLASGKKKEKADDKIEEAINGISLILDDSVSFSALPFSVLFAFDSYVITREQMEKVDAVAKLMWENPEICLAVVGYCSYTESKEYNHQLSESRAEAVKNELVRQGIHENRIITSGKGHSTLFGKSRSGVNRRVSFYRILH